MLTFNVKLFSEHFFALGNFLVDFSKRRQCFHSMLRVSFHHWARPFDSLGVSVGVKSNLMPLPEHLPVELREVR